MKDTQTSEDEMPPIYKILGPPGCGKTTFIQRQVCIAAEKHNPRDLLLTSFTKAAAAELARTRPGAEPLPLEYEQIGTLHSLCYQQIGKPPMAQTKDALAEWNERSPAYKLSGAGQSLDEAAVDVQHDTKADEFMAQYQRLRARMTPRSMWPGQVTMFARAWEAYKTETGRIDFQDMIELARTSYNDPTPPRGASILFLDEAQDCPPNQMDLIKKWARHCKYVIIAGDDDQTLYSYIGASPDTLSDEAFKAEHTTVLSQSFRVPAAVHQLAETWINTVQHREPKIYLPRHETPHDVTTPVAAGCVRSLRADYRQPEAAIQDAETQLAAGKSVMFLASCSYMLPHIIAGLKKRGIPFHNPYRLTRGDWNPLRGDTKKSTSTVSRVLSFMARADPQEGRWWTGKELKLWTDMLAVKGIMSRGTKKLIEELPDHGEVSQEFLLSVFDDATMDAAFEGNLDWLEDHALAQYRDALKYPAQLVKLRGPQVLREKPRAIVSTIHGVKGGESEVVYLFPDISVAGMDEWKRREGRDSIIRMFYVGITRASETLVVCQPKQGLYAAHLPLHVAQLTEIAS